MYSAGIPIGLLVDAKGPRPGAIFGSVLLGVGYFALYRGTELYGGPKSLLSDPATAYDGGPDSVSVPWLCFFACLTGVGGCAGFYGSLKTCENSPKSIQSPTAHIFSRLELAGSPWDCNRLSPVSLWSECLLLRIDLLLSLPGQCSRFASSVSHLYIHHSFHWKLPSAHCASPAVLRSSARLI